MCGQHEWVFLSLDYDVCPRVPGYYDRRKMIPAVFHLFVFYLTFWGIRCLCSNCSVALATKAEECQCCQEIDRCGEVMDQFGDPKRCITLHPGFKEVCLSKHVLEVAALGLKTKSGFISLAIIQRIFSRLKRILRKFKCIVKPTVTNKNILRLTVTIKDLKVTVCVTE